MLTSQQTGETCSGSLKCSGYEPHSTGTALRERANERLAEETKGLFLGPIPTSDFLNEFLPTASNASERPEFEASFEDLKKGETEMYASFADALAPSAPDLMFIASHGSSDTLRDRLAPDISVYPVDAILKAYDEDQSKSKFKTDFSKMDLFIQLKTNDFFDPFESGGAEDPYPFEKDSKEARGVRGQLVSYAAALVGSQFRIHTFCVLACGKSARFIRWDRGGAIVTESFDFVQEPHILAEFFWRYSHLDARWQGYDDSVVPFNPENENTGIEQTHFEKLKNENLKVHREFRILKVPERGDAEDEKDFIVSFPPKYTTHWHSPFGRGTRPMLAIDKEMKKVVFLKDYWRAEKVGKEGEIYELLESKNVPNIPPFGKGNDVRDHRTLTPELKTKNWARHHSKDMSSFRHYRMTLNAVAQPLTSFSSSQEFVSAIADAMEAHDHAYFEAKVLHRDISVGNILITKADEGAGGGRGLLIDWDLCVRMDGDPTPGPGGRPERTGTWEFMSAALLQEKEKFNKLEDDRESCLHVLTWTALRFTKFHSPIGFGVLLSPFEEAYKDNDVVKGGRFKMDSLIQRQIPKCVKFLDRAPLDDLIADLTGTFAFRYKEPPEDEYSEYYDSLSTNDPSIAKLPVYKYLQAMGSLERRGWLVDTFRRHLDKVWPTSDKPVMKKRDGTVESPKKRRRTGEVGVEDATSGSHSAG